MPFIPPETVEKARQVDLLTYLKACEPNELVQISGNHYCTREHDSLKISNGKWYWFSRGFGGYNALDYLIKVKDVPFMEAVERITGQVAYQPRPSQPKPEKPKVLLLPQVSPSTNRVHAILIICVIVARIAWMYQLGSIFYPISCGICLESLLLAIGKICSHRESRNHII